MFPQQHLKLSHQAVLLALASLAYPVTGYGAVAGRADFVIGNVVAIAPNGAQRPLTRGAPINVGDAVSTSAGARAQLRFSDGGFVSLQPNSQFRVDEYQYENKTDGREKGFFSLLKGGLRAITGAIGHINRNTYKVATPVATIGIRGTGYSAALNGGLLVNVGEGAISLTNNAGELVVTSGNAAFVADFNTAPKSTFDKPQTSPAGFLTPLPPSTTFIKGNEPTLYSGPGYVLAHAGVDGGSRFTEVFSSVHATFSDTSQLTGYDGTEGGTLGGANVSFSATDGIIGWGRWNGGTTANNGGSTHPLSLAGSDTFHYIVGAPTPETDITAMSNITATYSLLGGTRPTSSVQGLGDLNGGSLTAYFGTGTVNADLQISLPTSGSYTISATGISITNSTATFSGSIDSVTGSCNSGCSGSISGFFAGANASRAGVAYSFSDSGTVGSVSGVAAFTKSSSGPDGSDPNQ
ncbi:MAG: hypothetical protein A2Z95_08750 [Gallionellales bacterium GWA2_60_18]|nr:MAG: hypothetical protein A2Z95_08750 [Gallionellales bacterium GWA2_60_18]